MIQKQKEYVGRGSIVNLRKIFKAIDVSNIIIFADAGILPVIKKRLLPQMSGISFNIYSDLTPNPKYQELQHAISCLAGKRYDAYFAIGGGSVIDFAKSFRYYTGTKVPLIAAPTTAGTGSESTQFAVVYKNGEKLSLDSSEIMPDYAVVDSQFSEAAPRYLKVCCSMDAFCQALESYWSVRSTEQSKAYALKSLRLCRKYLVESVNTTNTTAAEQMAMAAHLAGKAINISRTTAAHALSYAITIEYGLPHGHAVALSIAGLFSANLLVTGSNCQDRRGPVYVQEVMRDLTGTMGLDKRSVLPWFHELFSSIGLEWRLSRLRIADLSGIVNSVNQDRLSNNPRNLKAAELAGLFEV